MSGLGRIVRRWMRARSRVEDKGQHEQDEPCHLLDSLEYRNNRCLPNVQHMVLTEKSMPRLCK